MRLAFWTTAWTITVAIVTFGAEFVWDNDPLITSIALIGNVLIGTGMIMANVRYLKDLDELEKKIQLDAMGVSLGVTLIGGIAYSMMDTTNLISMDAEISILVILMGITYMAAIMIGKMRYQ